MSFTFGLTTDLPLARFVIEFLVEDKSVLRLMIKLSDHELSSAEYVIEFSQVKYKSVSRIHLSCMILCLWLNALLNFHGSDTDRY